MSTADLGTWKGVLLARQDQDGHLRFRWPSCRGYGVPLRTEPLRGWPLTPKTACDESIENCELKIFNSQFSMKSLNARES